MGLKINGEGFSVSDSAIQRDAKEIAFEVEGRDTAEVRITDSGETDPAGRYRLRSDGDKLLLQRAGAATPAGQFLWPSALTLMELSSSGVTFKVPIDLSSLGGFTGMLIDTVPLDAISAVWLGEGLGFSEEPAGLFAFAAEGEDDPVYVPFWRKGEGAS
mgnify:CR=1 FL=1